MINIDEEEVEKGEIIEDENKSSCCRISFFEERRDWSLYLFSMKNK